MEEVEELEAKVKPMLWCRFSWTGFQSVSQSLQQWEPLYIYFNGQKSNLLSYQSKIIYTDLLEVCN